MQGPYNTQPLPAKGGIVHKGGYGRPYLCHPNNKTSCITTTPTEQIFIDWPVDAFLFNTSQPNILIMIH